MRIRSWILYSVLIAGGCGSETSSSASASAAASDDDKKSKSSSARASNSAGSPVLEWQKRPSKEFEGKLQFEDGEAPVKLTLVDGFTDGTPGFKGAAAFLLKDETSGAEVRVHLAPLKAIELVDDIKKAWEEEKGKILKAETTAAGDVVATAKWDGRIRAKVIRTLGSHIVECTGTSASPAAVENADKVLPWLEKLCLTMKSP